MIWTHAHLSVSRLKKFLSCPRSFFLQYVQPGPKEPPEDHLRFGVFLHAVLEDVYRWIVAEEYEGAFPEDILRTTTLARWATSGLTDLGLFREGMTLLRSYASWVGRVSHWSILGLEVPLDLTVDGLRVEGRIDRVDKVSDDTIALVDYKSNRLLFTPEELRDDLQMSVYGLACRRLYPWATRILFRFHLLRHSVEQVAVRTAEEIDAVAAYLTVLRTQTEQEPLEAHYPAKLNPNCVYCEHRTRCNAYQADLLQPFRLRKVLSTDLPAVAKEFDEVTSKAKRLYGRQRELETILLAAAEPTGELAIEGRTYRATQRSTSVVRAEDVQEAARWSGVNGTTLRDLLGAAVLPIETVEAAVKTLPPGQDRVFEEAIRGRAEKRYDRAKITSGKS